MFGRFYRRALPSALLLATPPALLYHSRSEQLTPYPRSASSTSSDIPVLSSLPALFSFPRFFSIPTPHAHADASVAVAVPPPSPLEAHPAGKLNPKLPPIPAAAVRAANPKDKESSKILVAFGDGVYDITAFIPYHPGGEQILMAAGGPLEPFFRLYPQHASEFVLDTLEEYRIGNLVVDEQWRREHLSSPSAALKDAPGHSNADPYAREPPRNPALIVQTQAPFTAEPPARELVRAHNTPNDMFYVRNHFPVPVIDAEEYRLMVVSRDGRHLASLSLADLQSKFEKVNVSATVQCAGNRRNELGRVRKVKGGGWETSAISNAQWAGARLSDVLQFATGFEGEVGGARGASAFAERHGAHVCMTGIDSDPVTGVKYEASVPLDVLRRHGDVLLAYEMNGEPLPRDHGFPVRAVVPGVVGARSVKWVGEVILSDDESHSHWQRKDYRSFSPSADWSSVDFASAPSIHEMPVVSAICAHTVDEEAGEVVVEGYAWSGDGKAVIRVDVSADGGKNWVTATLGEKAVAGRNEVYDWTLWSARVGLPRGEDGKEVELVCKAVDSGYNCQPDNAASIWNIRGLLNNSWHRVKVERGT